MKVKDLIWLLGEMDSTDSEVCIHDVEEGVIHEKFSVIQSDLEAFPGVLLRIETE